MSVFLPLLKQSGRLDHVHMTLVNVGSRKLFQEDDYASSGWEIFAPQLSIYGFDADADACDAANADLQKRQINWQEKHVPLAVSDTIGRSQLYVTRNPMCSSLYPPNEPYLNRFMGLLDLVATDYTVDLETTTLNAFCQAEGIEAIDFLQIDVQGADLNVLKGASDLLKTTLAIQIEVEFSPLYQGQPLFADVDTYLRSRDFTLFDLTHSACIRSRSPIHTGEHPGQLLWGDAYYFCDLLQPAEMLHQKTPAQIFKLACVADTMAFADYALEILEYLTLNYGDNSDYNFADIILDSLKQFPQIADNLQEFPIFHSLRQYIH